jgi:hypothetical protein
MKVCDLKPYVDTFRALPSASRPISLDFSRPWHFNHSYRETQVNFEKDGGIYIYSCPCEPWAVPFDQNAQEIWYIGKSDGALARRVWAHMGDIYEPGSREPCNPRFRYHEWADCESVSRDIRNAIAHGDTVVYTIKVEPLGGAPGIAKALEKYLLACCFRVDGKLPPLNVDL